MKYLSLLLFFLFITSSNIAAQSWQAVQPGKKVYFTNNIHYLRGMRIDSVRAAGTDTILYPFHSIRGKFHIYSSTEPPIGTLDSLGGSWLGSKIIYKQDGTTLFDNIWRDTIVIKTRAGLGQSWTFYDDTTSRYYEAMVTAIDTATIDGSPDSIKTINIQAKIAGVPVVDSINRMQIVLSKKNGFLQIFDLITFPYHLPGSVYNSQFPAFFDYYAEMLRNVATAEPAPFTYLFKRVNYQPADSTAIFDFNPGDRFEFDLSAMGMGESGTDTDSVLLKNINGSVTTYAIQRRTARLITTGPPPPAYNYGSSVYTLSITAHQKIRFADTAKMPEEWYSPHLYYYNPADTSHCYTAAAYTTFYTAILLPNARVNTFEPCGYLITLKGGLGVTYNSQCYDPLVSAQSELTYLQKGTITCGALKALSVKATPPAAGITSIYPLPAGKELFIENKTNEPIRSVTVYDITGRALRSFHFADKYFSIPVSQLPEGSYILEIDFNKQTERRMFSVLH